MLDDAQAKVTGQWTASTSGKSLGREYWHDGQGYVIADAVQFLPVEARSLSK